MESLDQEFASKPATVNGRHAPEAPRIPFGTKDIATQTMPFEWGQWIFTGMRAAELAGEKPKPFSWWLTEASHHFIIHTAMDDK